jgi:arginine deiminase
MARRLTWRWACALRWAGFAGSWCTGRVWSTPIWLGGSGQDWGRCHVEGGDVQPIGNGTVMIGMGERTTPQAVVWIARSLFRAGGAGGAGGTHEFGDR